MKDASPRIFRDLEKAGGRDGFDNIVGAAVLSYGSLRSASETKAREFARLVLPLWSKVSADTKRSLSACLSHAPRVPREIVERLIAEPIEISAPFLLSSPTLGDSDLKALALSPDRRVRKLIAERARAARTAKAAPFPVVSTVAAPPPSTVSSVGMTSQNLAQPDAAGPLSAADAETSYMLESGMIASEDASPPQDVAFSAVSEETVATAESPRSMPRLFAPPLVPDLAPPLPATARQAEGSAAALVRETLMRLALPGRRKSDPAAASGGPAPSLPELVAAAVRQDAATFYDGLVRMLGLGPDRLRQIVGDEGGERLAVALKAVGASHTDAMTVLMMLKPAIGLDVDAFESMTRYYRALKAADCTALARGDAAVRATAPVLQPQYQDLAPLARTEPRPSFGRRKTLPADVEAAKRKG